MTTPLLDGWQPPQGAGKPLAALATTFVLDPDFFESDCLGRFLSLTTQDEGTGSSLDTLARLEREDALGEPQVTVLADRSTAAERSSLRWDLLHCNVDGALLHSKVAILLWENAARVLIGSANLTPAGYRKQIEIGITADLGADCILPTQVLRDLADEVGTYLDLISGAAELKPVARARRVLKDFRDRIAGHAGSSNPSIRVALAPTNAGSSPLTGWEEVWQGPKPLSASQLSPFWDTDDRALAAVASQLTGQPKANRNHIAATVPTYDGSYPLPPYLAGKISTYRLENTDGEPRALHAKCLLLTSETWIAALVGSSNHTRSGLGLSSRPHRELNVWLGASRNSKEGKALAGLIPVDVAIELGEAMPAFDDEDEQAPVPLPLFFEFCQLSRIEDSGGWQVTLHFATSALVDDWSITATSGANLLTAERWRAESSPKTITCALPAGEVPSFLAVTWPEGSASWTVLVDDPHQLPPGPGASDLTARELFVALAARKSLTAAAQDRQRSALADEAEPADPLDPLIRFDDPRSLLREARSMSSAYQQLRRRLQASAPTVDAINARLTSPLGPIALADKIVDALLEQTDSAAGTLFKLAELALAVGRANWSHCFSRLNAHDTSLARGAVTNTLEHIGTRIDGIENGPDDIAEYARRAVKEARVWLGN